MINKVFHSLCHHKRKLIPPPCLLSADVSAVKPNLWDNHHSSTISSKSSECEEMLCCQLEGSSFWVEKGVSEACQRPPAAPGFLSRDRSMASITCHWRNKMASALDFHPRVFIMIVAWLKLKSFHNESLLEAKGTSWRYGWDIHSLIGHLPWKAIRFFVQPQTLQGSMFSMQMSEIDNCNPRSSWKGRPGGWRTRGETLGLSLLDHEETAFK